MTTPSRTLAPQRSSSSLAARLGRGLVLGATLVWLTPLFASCSSGTETCEGSTTRVCTLLVDQCADTTGCKPIAPHCANICETRAQPACLNTGCVWQDGLCRSPCSSFTSESACNPGYRCTWTGQQCVDSCGDASTPDTCPASMCHWQTCTGTAPNSCDSYSAEKCPVALGCDRVKHGGYSAQ